MKKILTALTFIIIAFFANAQWEVNSLPVPGYYIGSDIHYLNNNIGFLGGTTALLGGNAKISKTLNGGASWTEVFTIPGSSIEDFYFINSSKGFAVGGGGLIAKTLDGGSTWTHETFTNPNTESPEVFQSIHFANENTGYIAGGFYEMRVLKTTDGGTTWNALTMPEYFQRLNAVHFTDANTGYVVGGDEFGGGAGKIYKTTDGGSTWEELDSGLDGNYYRDIYFTDSTNGVIGCGIDGIILKTSNAGQSWVQIDNPGESNRIAEFSFVDSNLGYACTISGEIIKTTNGGASWTLDATLVFPGGLAAMYSISVPSSTYGVTVGLLGFHAEMSGSSDISDIKNDSGALIYPNPTKDNITLEFKDANASVEIYDSMGKRVFEAQNVPNQLTVNLESHPEGVYFVRISTQEKVYSRKITKH